TECIFRFTPTRENNIICAMNTVHRRQNSLRLLNAIQPLRNKDSRTDSFLNLILIRINTELYIPHELKSISIKLTLKAGLSPAQQLSCAPVKPSGKIA